jgi:hypothetical protein
MTARTRFTLCPVLVIATGFLATPARASVAVYDFESLNSAALAGQDNWTGSAASSVVAGTAPDTTLVAAGGAETDRVNDGAFGYAFTSSGSAAVYVDFLAGDTPESDFWLGRVSQAGADAHNLAFDLDIQGNTIHVYRDYVFVSLVNSPLPAEMQDTWVTLAAMIDFSANSNNGSLDLFVKKQGDPDANYQAVVTGLDMGLQSLTLADVRDPANWDGISISLSNNAVSQLDNIVIAVPEPASLVLLALGALSLVRRRTMK